MYVTQDGDEQGLSRTSVVLESFYSNRLLSDVYTDSRVGVAAVE